MAYAIEKLQDAHSKKVREANGKYEKQTEKQTQVNDKERNKNG